MLLVLLAVLALGNCACDIKGDEIQDTWDYVKVRPNAYQFYWFMKTPCEGAQTKPIIIWLQGGPGGSGTGYGNFMEVGPLDNNLLPRNHTWLKSGSLLFIDSPVGAGFSYVTDKSAFTTNVYTIADDLVTTLEAAVANVKAKYYGFGAVPPIYIFSESYGGKVAPVFGAHIVKAQKAGRLADVILGGVAIGDGAVSLMDAAVTYPDYLFQTSQIDGMQYNALHTAARQLEESYNVQDYETASYIIGYMMSAIAKLTDDMFFYNIQYHHQPSPSLNTEEISLEHLMFIVENIGKLTPKQKAMLPRRDTVFKKLTIDYNGENVKKLMNTEMRAKFGIIPDSVSWGAQAIDCHTYLSDEMIIDVISSVDECLDFGVKVTVYNGMLDFIINSAGQERWMSRLMWDGLQGWWNADRVPLYPVSETESQRTGAFYKGYKNLEYYWILMSGHMVPIDAPEMALDMVNMITGQL